jgi:hypothetical protein
MPKAKGPEWDYVAIIYSKGTLSTKVKRKLCNRVFCGGASCILHIQVSGRGVAPCQAEESKLTQCSQTWQAKASQERLSMQMRQLDRAKRSAAPAGAEQAAKKQQTNVVCTHGVTKACWDASLTNASFPNINHKFLCIHLLSIRFFRTSRIRISWLTHP